MKTILYFSFVCSLFTCLPNNALGQLQGGLTIDWADNILTIHGDFPGKELKTWYLEAYCRPNSHEAEWNRTVIGHKTRLMEKSADKKKIVLECKLNDGVIAKHVITAGADNVDFQITVQNPTKKESAAHWGQPCIRVGDFTGLGEKDKRTYAYLKKSFVFQNGRLQTMPTSDWATKARYEPGQVWRAPGVKPADVNPRPLNKNVPDNGLIGCFGKHDKLLMATAFEPYQELFQGVITCLHSDFRIGGLKPGEEKKIKGKIYILKNDVAALVKRYKKDFQSR